MKAEKITLDELQELLASINLPKRIKLYTKTSAKLPKKYNPLGEVYQLRNLLACVNFDCDPEITYNSREAGNEPDYLEKIPAWAEKIVRTPLVKHSTNGTVYLRVMPLQQIGKQPISYRNKRGHKVAAEDVKDYLDRPAKVSNPFVYFLLKLESIVTIEIDKRVYKVTK